MNGASLQQHRQMVSCSDPVLSIREQGDLLSIHRSGLYYQPVGESEENLQLISLIDEQ
jgi:putative transposase